MSLWQRFVRSVRTSWSDLREWLLEFSGIRAQNDRARVEHWQRQCGTSRNSRDSGLDV
jgi:hypothetical protein